MPDVEVYYRLSHCGETIVFAGWFMKSLVPNFHTFITSSNITDFHNSFTSQIAAILEKY